MKKFSLSLALLATFSFVGCGGGSSSLQNNSSSTTTYNGAGSRWSLSFKNDGNLTIKEANSNLEINATYTDLASGFRKLVVKSSSDTTKASVGAVTYGFELPGYMFPWVAFGENKLLPTIINDGECPNTVEHNFIVSFAKSNTKADGTPQDFNTWGTFGHYEYKSDENKTYVTVYKRDGTQTSFSPMNRNGSITSGCVKGKYYDPNGNPTDPDKASTTAYFSKNGGIIWQQNGIDTNYQSGQHNDRIENDFMIPKEPNLNSINQIDGNYIGYAISGNGQSSIGYTNTPVSVTANNGTLTIKEINVTSAAIGNTLGSITLSSEVSGTKGLWEGQVTINSSSEGIGCAIDLDAANSGKNVVICGGMYPDGTTKKLYSLILVSK